MSLLGVAIVGIAVLPLLVAAELDVVLGASMTVELLGPTPNVKREPAERKNKQTTDDTKLCPELGKYQYNNK